MPINFDISQVITALTNLKNAIEKPGPLLDDLGDLVVEKLQQTTPEEGGTLRKAMSKRGKPHKRGRKWTLGIGDPDALGTPGTMQPGTGSDKGLIAAFLKVYRDQRREERAEKAQVRQSQIETRQTGRQARRWQNQIIKDQDRRTKQRRQGPIAKQKRLEERLNPTSPHVIELRKQYLDRFRRISAHLRDVREKIFTKGLSDDMQTQLLGELREVQQTWQRFLREGKQKGYINKFRRTKLKGAEQGVKEAIRTYGQTVSGRVRKKTRPIRREGEKPQNIVELLPGRRQDIFVQIEEKLKQAKFLAPIRTLLKKKKLWKEGSPEYARFQEQRKLLSKEIRELYTEWRGTYASTSSRAESAAWFRKRFGPEEE